MSQQFRSFPAPGPRPQKPNFDRPRYMSDRERDQIKTDEKRAAEIAEKKRLEMNTNNFPTLSGSAALPMERWSGDTSFAKLATDWKKTDDDTRVLEQIRRKNADLTRMGDGINFIHRRRRSEDERYMPEYEEETAKKGPDADGWEMTEKKVRKPKKQMSDAEMERYYSVDVDEDGNSDNDHNADLGESNQRREFY